MRRLVNAFLSSSSSSSPQPPSECALITISGFCGAVCARALLIWSVLSTNQWCGNFDFQPHNIQGSGLEAKLLVFLRTRPASRQTNACAPHASETFCSNGMITGALLSGWLQLNLYVENFSVLLRSTSCIVPPRVKLDVTREGKAFFF